METSIPLHALVLDAVPGGAADFPDHEILDPRLVADDLTGGRLTPRDKAVAEEVLRRADVKLTLGERVVVRQGLDGRARERLAAIARRHGVPAIWLVPRGCERDMARGDGGAEVVVVSERGRVQPVLPLPEGDIGPTLGGYAGVTVVGDIHGMHQSMLAALSWARSRRHFVVLLGDVVDYGHATLDCADEAWRLVTRGEGTIILGNHERKIARWLSVGTDSRRQPHLSDGNRVTVQALGRLGPSQRDAWAGRFRGLLWRARSMRRIGPHVMAHAAIHPSYWTGGDDDAVEQFALFGEPDPAVKPPRFATSYRWVDSIPEDRVVIVGHDVRSMDAPRSVTGAKGGTAVFLDTGCGKGGPLSSADLRFGEDGVLRLANLNVF